MAWITIDLWGDEPEETTPSKKEVKLESKEDLRDLPLRKQVINIMGKIVTI